MTKLDEEFASRFLPTDKPDAAHGEAWFWITLTVACLPWIVALVVWRT